MRLLTAGSSRRSQVTMNLEGRTPDSRDDRFRNVLSVGPPGFSVAPFGPSSCPAFSRNMAETRDNAILDTGSSTKSHRFPVAVPMAGNTAVLPAVNVGPTGRGRDGRIGAWTGTPRAGRRLRLRRGRLNGFCRAIIVGCRKGQRSGITSAGILHQRLYARLDRGGGSQTDRQTPRVGYRRTSP